MNPITGYLYRKLAYTLAAYYEDYISADALLTHPNIEAGIADAWKQVRKHRMQMIVGTKTESVSEREAA